MGLFSSYFLGFLIFIWKLNYINKKGSLFLVPLAGGFGINLIFLIGGTIFARYSLLLGHYTGFALGYLAGAFLCLIFFTLAVNRKIKKNA